MGNYMDTHAVRTSKYARALQQEKESIKYLWETMIEMIYVYLYLIFFVKILNL
jgi:hypothetical protein